MCDSVGTDSSCHTLAERSEFLQLYWEERDQLGYSETMENYYRHHKTLLGYMAYISIYLEPMDTEHGFSNLTYKYMIVLYVLPWSATDG